MKSPQVALVLVVAVVVGIVLLTARRAGPVAKDSPTHRVTLHWAPSAGASSYNVYRSATSGGPYTQIGHSLTPTYVDIAVPGRAVFYYVVTAVRDGKESAHSQEIKASVP